MGAEESRLILDSDERRAELRRIEEDTFQQGYNSHSTKIKSSDGPEPTIQRAPPDRSNVTKPTLLETEKGSELNPSTKSNNPNPNIVQQPISDISGRENVPKPTSVGSTIGKSISSMPTRPAKPKQGSHVKPTGELNAIALANSTKRANPVLPYDGSRPQPLQKRPKPDSSLRSPRPLSASGNDSEKLCAGKAGPSDERLPPKWYQDLNRDKTRAKGESNVDTLLGTLRDFIKKAKKAQQDAKSRRAAFAEIRTRLHKIAFLPTTPKLLKNNRMLDRDDGLPQLFDSAASDGVAWPWDIRADAEELYIKWCRGVFETDLLRGILSTKSGKRDSDKLDPSYAGKVAANYHGNGDLLNGQWWPTRLTMLRDGAHGDSQAGISGAVGRGAYSCVMSGGLDADGVEYPDEDHGDWVLYCGTDSPGRNGEVSAATKRMIESVGQAPVRLIRSSNVRSAYAPEIGYRYDGLYSVIHMERLDPVDSRRQRHRFHLERIPGQTPLRGGNGPEKRPTAEEIHAYQTNQRLMRGNAAI